MTSARTPEGRRLWFVHNWSWDQVGLPVPAPMTELLSGTPLAQGDVLSLVPWDGRVLAPPAEQG